MKQLLLKSITFYQIFVSPTLKQLFGMQAICRYSPTCSEYAKQQIKKEGALKGLGLALQRILSCQPFKFSFFNIKSLKHSMKTENFKLKIN